MSFSGLCLYASDGNSTLTYKLAHQRHTHTHTHTHTHKWPVKVLRMEIIHTPAQTKSLSSFAFEKCHTNWRAIQRALISMHYVIAQESTASKKKR